MALRRIAEFCRDCIEGAASRGGYWTGAVLLTLLGGFVLVETQAFSVATAQWLSLGAGAAAIVVSGALMYIGLRRERIEMLLPPVAGALIGAWTVVTTSGIFSDQTAKWIGFADGGGC